MGYTAPITQVAGTPILSADWNTYVRDNLLFLANPPACRVYHNTTQSMAELATQVVTFNSERYDTNGMHSAGSPTRITFATAGLYTVTFSGRLADATDYLCISADCRLNGSTVIGCMPSLRHDSGDGAPAYVAYAFTYKFAAADYIEARIYHNNGAGVARNLLSTGDVSPEFAATWLGLG